MDDAKAEGAQSASSSSDPSQWRASKLRPTDTIAKTYALAQYHLKAADLVGIPFETTETVVNGVKRAMYLYNERAIERRAWEMFGGPEAFDARLAKLKARHLEKGNKTAFQQPGTYEDPRGKVAIVSLAPSTSRSSSDPYVGKSPRLLDIKGKMPLWLWTTCNRALLAVDEGDEMAMALGGGRFTKAADREWPMRAALRLAKAYPPRPDQKLPSSECVDRVRAVLAEAPLAPKPDDSDWGRDDIPDLTFHSGHSGPEPTEEYRWSGDYLERLFTSLIQLIEELGLGNEGWNGIRWEVYDKHAECLHEGPQYDRREGRWVDWAAQWLDGRFADVGIQLIVSCRGKCPAGLVFNDMLPFRHPQGHRFVGC
ncbi:hypothetical protein GSI_02856 [Ganoderma sinense ZZ0214-1]|uniref:Uncharacterized protein n=1 Tax=Ganoderma sinense ZZ0214-1 TaxID=1077348 RepID=A0A2G8SNB5_9APHY|nr:hypothetical protein GSI_02856 [Ganoderma sinense ZZ0214-1]